MTNNIRKLRQKIGISQGKLASLCQTTPQQISRLENAQRQLTQNWMQLLANALSCSPAELFDAASNNNVKSHSLVMREKNKNFDKQLYSNAVFKVAEAINIRATELKQKNVNVTESLKQQMADKIFADAMDARKYGVKITEIPLSLPLALLDLYFTL